MQIYLTLAMAVIVVLACAVLRVSRARMRHPERPRAVVELPPEAAQQVDALIRQGKQVEAVKAVRVATGAGLMSGVDTVEARRVRLGDDAAG